MWIVQMECGDYYCGCGGGHVVGVYDDPQRAYDAAVEVGVPDYDRAKAVTRVEMNETRKYDYHATPGGDWSTGSWT